MPPKPEPVKSAETAAPAKTNPIKTIWASAFLSALALVVILERLVPDFGFYLFNWAAKAADQNFLILNAQFGLWQNVAGFLVSMLAASWLLKRLGRGKTMAATALANALGFLAFAFSPGLATAIAHNGTEGLLRYTTFRAAKESAYASADRSVIYKVKPFIEMFLYRFARFFSGGILLLLTNSLFLGLGPVWVAWAGVPLAVLWILAALKLGREAKKLETK